MAKRIISENLDRRDQMPARIAGRAFIFPAASTSPSQTSALSSYAMETMRPTTGSLALLTPRLQEPFKYYVIGAALDETSGYAKGPSSLFPVSVQETEARFPRVAEVGPYFKREHFDTTFAAGLEILLDGIQRAREKARGS